MNKNQPFQSVLIAMVCVSLLTGVTLAQQPFDTLPDASQPAAPADAADVPQDDPLTVRPSESRLPTRPFSPPLDRAPIQDQSVVVNTRFAGWEAASTTVNGNSITNLLRGNWIMLDPNGRFEGQVITASDADSKNMIVFLLNMGRLVKQTRVDAEGRFDFNNVQQGAYSLVGWGPNGFFGFGVNILANNPNADASLLNSIKVRAFQNKTTINTDWIRYYAPGVNFRVYGRYPSGEGRDDPPALFGLEGLQAETPPSVPANSISSQSVSSTPDGRLVGRIHQMNSLSGRPVDLRTTKVMLFEGDSVVATTTTNYFGVFQFAQVPSGTYGLVAVGVDGAGMITVNVDNDLRKNIDDGEFVMWDDVIDFCLMSSESIGWLNNYASEVAYGRALMGPRPKNVDPSAVCPNCGNQGCPNCQAQLKAFCDSAESRSNNGTPNATNRV